MRINLYDIAKRKELDRQLSLGLDELQQLIGDYEGYTPSSSYDVEIEARKIAEGFRVKVLVKGSALGQCTRCLDEVSVDLDVEHTFTLLPSREEPGEQELEGDELDVYFYESVKDELDLMPIIQEVILLGLDPYLVCAPDCAGLCAQCGARLNESKCSCEKPIDPRWADLLELKKRRKDA